MKAGADYIAVAVTFICNDGKGNFVFHKRSNNCRDEKGRWDWGGGRLEFGETLDEAVLREVQEEYGVVGKIQEQLSAFSAVWVEDGIKVHWVKIPFFIKIDVKKARIMEPDKATEIGIFTLDNLPRPLHSGVHATMSRNKKCFEKYKKRVNQTNATTNLI